MFNTTLFVCINECVNMLFELIDIYPVLVTKQQTKEKVGITYIRFVIFLPHILICLTKNNSSDQSIKVV